MKYSILLSACAALILSAACSSEETAPPKSVAADASPEPIAPAPPQPLPPEPEAAPADNTPGLAVGERAPEFELLDQHGQQQSLSEMLAKSNVALVYYRSADW